MRKKQRTKQRKLDDGLLHTTCGAPLPLIMLLLRYICLQLHVDERSLMEHALHSSRYI
ncbi:hypothetical protein SLEP1_g43235 [Rubroshorea leprosula]|uniref:Uncharacterized protein n=1 Tax=Rubroshorea leprosula TaxID=152421 RepID=A0AAV5LDV7_9ROSI|nr:hypothetical protein SLEP1_g43235 [Rubroshorea leprosula]